MLRPVLLRGSDYEDSQGTSTVLGQSGGFPAFRWGSPSRRYTGCSGVPAPLDRGLLERCPGCGPGTHFRFRKRVLRVTFSRSNSAMEEVAEPMT